jgi:hypothetical protein
MSHWSSLTHIFSAAYAIVIRSSEHELSPPMLDHIVDQVVSGGTEASEEPSRPLRQKRWATSESEAQGNESR